MPQPGKHTAHKHTALTAVQTHTTQSYCRSDTRHKCGAMAARALGHARTSPQTSSGTDPSPTPHEPLRALHARAILSDTRHPYAMRYMSRTLPVTDAEWQRTAKALITVQNPPLTHRHQSSTSSSQSSQAWGTVVPGSHGSGTVSASASASVVAAAQDRQMAPGQHTLLPREPRQSPPLA